MTRHISAAILLLAAGLIFGPAQVSARESSQVSDARLHSKTGKFRNAVEMYEKGMYERAGEMFEEMARAGGDFEVEGWRVLCAVRLRDASYEVMMDNYIENCPYSGLIPQIRFHHASNLFDAGYYADALAVLDKVARAQLYRKQVSEYLFKKAYCSFEQEDYDLALTRFREVESRPASDYTAPSRYSIAYISYLRGSFAEAERWFGKASSDYRFKKICTYYIYDCKYMQKKYREVSEEAPSMLDKVPEDRVPQMLRMISESFLVLGDAASARKYYDMNASVSKPKTREDFFYAGSLYYALKEYQKAIDNFSLMTSRTDSIGQIADYQMAYSYILTKNKVAAMEAFKDASEADFDRGMARDAYFNYAKLAFDLNNDYSAFDSYLKRYPDTKRGDKIYSYMAMACLYGRDYAGAVAAYDNIDYFDADMKSNYMKANYMRAKQLISDGSYRAAVPYLKAAAYYSDRRSMFNQLSRYWLAEAYYRDNRFQEALAQYTELYNTSALYGKTESALIPFNIAYCHYKTENWAAADKWFGEYLAGSNVRFRKDALLRKGDCLFIQKRYSDAVAVYDAVIQDYYDVNDIYPYYQAALSYGLAGNAGEKKNLLSRVLGADASSAFYPEAVYELGRAYVDDNEEDKAIDVFKGIVAGSKDSTYIARSLIELGMISRNRADMPGALGYYKKVVEQMPHSEYSEDALLAVESIYQSMNDPEGYLEYIASIGKQELKTEDEKEMMIFNAAEQIFLSENYPKALVALQKYIDRYPAGLKLYQAEFYRAESYKALGEKEKALDSYARVMENGSGSFVEISTLNFSNLSYMLHRYDDAYAGYSSLLENAQLDNNRYTALLGMMRSAYLLHDNANALAAADKVAADGRSGEDIRLEADYVRAKSYLAMSRRDEAFAILEKLAEKPSTAQGAEAKYLIILSKYDEAMFDEVENMVYDFADAAPSRQYWLAKSFIVLGDSFAERGDLEQAKATFESVLTGYVPEKEDDVHDNVRMRLARLAEMMKTEPADSVKF